MNKIDRLNTQINEGMDDFIQQFPTDQETQAAINAHLKHTYEQEVTITKTRQLRNLKKLIERKNKDKHRHPEINKKWMRNLSNTSTFHAHRSANLTDRMRCFLTLLDLFHISFKKGG